MKWMFHVVERNSKAIATQPNKTKSLKKRRKYRNEKRYQKCKCGFGGDYKFCILAFSSARCENDGLLISVLFIEGI